MDIRINLNDPRILEAHVEQALPQAGLEEVKDRIIVGSAGGLAYNLFQDKKQFPSELHVFSRGDVLKAKEYFDAVRTYLTSAAEHGRNFDFGIVIINNEITDRIGLGYEMDSEKLNFVYHVGLGSADVKSIERLKRFIEMIKSGRGKLDRQYQGLVNRAKEFILR